MSSTEVNLKDAGPIHCESCDIYFDSPIFTQQLLDTSDHFENEHNLSVKKNWKTPQELDSIEVKNCTWRIK